MNVYIWSQTFLNRGVVMAIGTAPQVPREAPIADQRDIVIQQQLNRTRRQVWMVELGTSLMGLAIGVLGFFLILALIDHWVLPFGAVARWLALILLISATTLYLIRFVVPLVIHSIHPLYAARTIERSTPALKNSVLNFLFFRNQPDAVPTAVYENLKRTAADNLSKVSVDTTVDRGRLIRVLYFLTAVIAICALYKVASPKDPFQTASRVFRPWAAIAAPSRVEIVEVQPGSASVTFGDKVEITAVVRGVRGSDRVQLVYSTADEQIVDRHLVMEPDENGLKYSCTLPPDDEGLQQTVSYRVLAGDAISPTYELSMIAQAMIFVERLQYDFPSYMQRPQQIVQGQGDIEAWEGTMVTVRAKANKAIREAYVEWDPLDAEQAAETSTNSNSTSKTPAPARRLDRLVLDSENMEAWGAFPLQLSPDRKKPIHGSYQVRFVTDTGQRNVSPVQHRITVLPDLAPQIDILSPRKRNVEIPENGQQIIEVRALDPDFGLARVVLSGSAADHEPWEHELLNDPKGFRGQFMQKYEFVPSEIGLKEGDVFTYRATAEDNRQNYQGQPAPNQEFTIEYQFTITTPIQPRASRDSQAKKNEPQDGGPSEPMDSDTEQNSKADRSSSKANQQKQPMNDKKQKDKEGKTEQQESEPQKNEQAESDKQEDTTERQKSEKNRNNDSEQTEKSDENQSQSGDQSGSEGENSQAQNGEGGQSSAKRRSSSKGEEGDEQSSSETGSGDSADGQSGSSSEDGSNPRDPKSVHDGERMERLLKRIEKEKGASQQPSGGGPGSDQTAEEQNTGEQNPPDQNSETQDTEAQNTEKQNTEKQNTEKQNTEKRSTQGQGTQEKDAEAQPQTTSQPQGSSRQDPSQQRRTSSAASRNREEGTVGSQQSSTGNDGDAAKPQSAAGSAKPTDEQKKEQSTKEQPETTPMPNGSGEERPRPEGEKQLGTENGDEGSGGREAPMQQQEKEQQPAEQDKQTPDGAANGSRPGAGAGNKQPSGAPSAGQRNQDRNKQQKPDNAPEKETVEPPGVSQSKKQSDSKGQDTPGNRSGGGGAGGGQNTKQQGSDAPGSTTESDDGQGTGNQTGEGETTDRPGGQQPSRNPTGESGDERGPGSGETQDGQGDQDGGQQPQSDQQRGEPSRENSGARGSHDGSGATRPGGGLPGERTPQDHQPPEAAPIKEADPNLEYARKATDLVIEYLKDQQQKAEPDQELLDELGWSKEELDEFVNRWERLKNSAEKDPKAQRELDDSLRSLGLQPEKDSMRQGDGSKDKQRGNTDAGARSTPPTKWLQKFDLFRKGAAKAEDEQE